MLLAPLRLKASSPYLARPPVVRGRGHHDLQNVEANVDDAGLGPAQDVEFTGAHNQATSVDAVMSNAARLWGVRWHDRDAEGDGDHDSDEDIDDMQEAEELDGESFASNFWDGAGEGFERDLAAISEHSQH